MRERTSKPKAAKAGPDVKPQSTQRSRAVQSKSGLRPNAAHSVVSVVDSDSVPGPNRRIGRHPILTFEDSGPVNFIFEGRPMTGRRGETIAAALAANGVRLFRHAEKTRRPRGFFCAVGKCASCLMVVDGRPNTMVCMEPLREGVKVERQTGRGKLP
jgi:hypothetical protein